LTVALSPYNANSTDELQLDHVVLNKLDKVPGTVFQEKVSADSQKALGEIVLLSA
jgi:hypothetical protein